MSNQTLMAPRKRKLEKTSVGEEVLDLVTPYIQTFEDRCFVSLVSRHLYDIEGLTRKNLTVHTLYYPNPADLSRRFPFIESLTLKGPPSNFKFDARDDYGIRISITPWIEQLALEFRCLKELCIRHLVVHDEDLETLARTRGKDLRVLKIKNCKGFRRDGLMHVSKYCNRLKTFCLRDNYSSYMDVNDRIWLHELALNSTVLERLHVPTRNIYYGEADLELLAKNCCNSLISLKIGDCYLSMLGDAFRYAVRLERFAGTIHDEKSALVGFQLPPSICSLSIGQVTRYPFVLPFVNHIKKLKLVSVLCPCLLLQRCPNLEVLYTEDVCGDLGLQVIGQSCKKLRELINYNGLATHVGLIAMAKGCKNLECLVIRLGDITNEAIKVMGTHLKNLRMFRMILVKKDGTKNVPLDNGIRSMLMGCNKLETLDMRGRLTDVGLEYIGKYGRNLRFLSLTRVGKTDAGLVNLSYGCPKLRELKLMDCPFSKQVVTSFVFNMPSLRYVWLQSSSDRTDLALIRPEFQL